jgi:NADPH-dependent 2,4-dienoyl-CoA reductase/sulfur reductase-like enzyme
MKIIIIGNSIGGISALKEVRKFDEKSEITILSKENFSYYSPVILPYYIEGRLNEEQLFSKNTNMFIQKNAKLMLNENVLNINTNEKIVKTEKHLFQYDKLIVASGASARKLRISGSAESYVLRTFEDAKKIKNIKGRNIIIIGAGPVGIELALALVKQKKKITLIEMMDSILSTVFSKIFSSYIEKQLIDIGIEIYKNEKVIEITPGKNYKEVKTDNKNFRGDAIIMAVGVRPNTDFLDENIKVGKYGGILVDDFMRSSDPNVFGAGDCIELKNSIENAITPIPVWPNAFETGRIAGANVAGRFEKYDGGIRINSINILNKVYFSLGNVWQGDKKLEIKNNDILEVYNIKNNKIIGAEIMGDVKWTGVIKRFLLTKKEIKMPFQGIDEIKEILLPQKL